MNKEELRLRLLEARQQYIDKNEKRLTKIQPLWDKTQSVVPGLDALEPYIEFCDTQELQDLWWYGRVTVSSAPLSGEVGRRIHYLVRDTSTGFVLGIVGLASDLTIPIRDKHIGWTVKDKWEGKRINYLMNIQHCVSTPEFGNYLIGKLCALSTKSKEVQERFDQKYGHSMAMMTVTSLYGKSSLYNRLSGFEYLGTTKGYSSLLVPLAIKQQMRDDYKATKGKHSEIYYNEDGTVRERYGVVKGYQKLAKYIGVQSIDNFRGVYVVPLSHNYQEFLRQETDVLELVDRKDFSTLTAEWTERWYLPRLERIESGELHVNQSN